jgi:glycine dehydrogenase
VHRGPAPPEEDVGHRGGGRGQAVDGLRLPRADGVVPRGGHADSKAELDRLCDALIAIREESREIEEGKAPKDNNVLRNTPHTARVITVPEWNRKLVCSCPPIEDNMSPEPSKAA